MSRLLSKTRGPSPSKIKVAEHTPPSPQPGSPVERKDVKMFFAQDLLPSDGVDDDAGKDATRLHDADIDETYDGKRLCAVFPAQHGMVCSA